MLSIKEVARLTGLSTATVSRALDPRYADRVKPSTRKKILAVCDSADFRPDAAARSFVTGKSYKVMVGCMTETSCAVSAAAQLAPAADFCDLDGNLLITNDLFTGMEVVDGHIVLPDRPGIGIVPSR